MEPSNPEVPYIQGQQERLGPNEVREIVPQLTKEFCTLFLTLPESKDKWEEAEANNPHRINIEFDKNGKTYKVEYKPKREEGSLSITLVDSQFAGDPNEDFDDEEIVLDEEGISGIYTWFEKDETGPAGQTIELNTKPALQMANSILSKLKQ